MPAKKKTKKASISAPKSQPPLKNALIGLGVIGALALGIYSIQTYNKTEIETVTVPGVEHIHATLLVTICGKKFNLPRNTGNTENSHTHKEENTLHWHAKTVSENVRNMKYVEDELLEDKFPKECKKGVKTKTSLTVNGQNRIDAQNYLWQDGDKLELTFE